MYVKLQPCKGAPKRYEYCGDVRSINKDCAARALTNLLNIPYSEAYDEFYTEMNNQGHSWYGIEYGASPSAIDKIYTKYGLRKMSMDEFEGLAFSVTDVAQLIDGIVQVDRHVVAVKNCQVYDVGDSRHMEAYEVWTNQEI